MPAPALEILFEDNHLLVVNKPAGYPTQGAAAGEVSVATLAKEYLKRQHDKPGNVFIGVVSRLDALVTGALVLAKTSKAAARLTAQFRQAEVQKTYWAVVEGNLPSERDRLTDWLWKDDRQQKVILVPPATPDAREARLSYRKLASLSNQRTLLAISLETGRKHQIRVQLAARRLPILGDAKYGSTTPFAVGIGLHARRLEIEHPTLKTMLRFLAPLPGYWRTLGLSEERATQWDE